MDTSNEYIARWRSYSTVNIAQGDAKLNLSSKLYVRSCRLERWFRNQIVQNLLLLDGKYKSLKAIEKQ